MQSREKVLAQRRFLPLISYAIRAALMSLHRACLFSQHICLPRMKEAERQNGVCMNESLMQPKNQVTRR